MEVDVKQIHGNWDLGYSLDKHTTRSIPIGPNEWGHMQFDTLRPEAGEALFQLKYRSDFSQIQIIAAQMHQSLYGHFRSAGLIIPMPPSKHRARQPVVEIARALAQLMNIPCYENLLVKTTSTPQMKDIPSREEKVQTLMNSFTIYDQLPEGIYDILIIDDLYDTGSSLEAATNVLRNYPKIENIFVATITRKR